LRWRSYGLFPLAVLLMLAGMTLWLERATRLPDPRPDGRDRHDPDFIAENFTVRQLDASGNVKYAMSAQRMLHYPDDESTEVFEPRLTYLASPPAFHLQARRGSISKDGKMVVLRDEVKGRRQPGPSDPGMSFATPVLTVWPDEEVARTDAPVSLTHGASVVAGVGMDADNLQRTLRLRQQVTATIHTRERRR
jgi:lipopolysaccharide export system protein LptC